MTETFASRIKTKALDLGFSKVGIAEAVELTEEGARLREWLALGYQATMGWMDRTFDRRVDPRLVLPNARSVVVVAHNYYTPHDHADDPDVGKISRYAWGDDYHDVLPEKLDRLLAWIKAERPGTEGKICVDAQPAMDKAWAVRAGIGWLGKHGCVITREFGSWVFLGLLILDIDLDADVARVPDHCGSCTACIDACPTDAIVEPYVLDSRRCISFATIEAKGDALDVPTSGWVFGCDICQDVCPWSRFSKPTEETRFEPRDGLVTPRLDELAGMTEAEFRARFAGSPIARAKHRGLMRNVKK